MVPLDELCRFSRPVKISARRSVEKIDKLLHPKTIGIMGVSATRKNFGRIILENVLSQGFRKEDMLIFKNGIEQIDGIRCLPNLKTYKTQIKKKLDLFIVAVGADQVPALVDEIIKLDAADSVMLIPGGMGETHDSKDRAQHVIQKIDNSHETKDGGSVFLGANCMGVVSRPGRYDTWFIPEEKLPKTPHQEFHRAALISQSGAFMLHRSHQYPQMKPAYLISMGNQTDLTLGDMVHYFKDADGVDVIAVYAEGFNDLDGLEFCKAVRQAVLTGKEVVFYKAGRTLEGKAATSSHTTALAGDYMVCENCVKQAGAIVARTFSEFQELVVLAETLNQKAIKGNRLAAVSGAGFEAVGMADSIQSDDFQMKLAGFEKKTLKKLAEFLKKKRLDALVTLSNPLDITPAADDDTHAQITEILTQDTGVDAVVVSLDPMSPAMKTLDNTTTPDFDMHHEKSIKHQISDIARKNTIPVITVVDGGRLYDPLRDALIKDNVPVFTVCDTAIAALSLYIQDRLNAEAIRSQDCF